jgi:hypothetical protein
MNARLAKDDGKPLTAFGHQLDQLGRPIRATISTKSGADYGADPIGDGTFRMVPSGDVVDLAERRRRLGM